MHFELATHLLHPNKNPVLVPKMPNNSWFYALRANAPAGMHPFTERMASNTQELHRVNSRGWTLAIFSIAIERKGALQ